MLRSSTLTHNKNIEKSLGQATQLNTYLNNMSHGQNKTSAQPQVTLTLLRSNSMKFSFWILRKIAGEPRQPLTLTPSCATSSSNVSFFSA